MESMSTELKVGESPSVRASRVCREGLRIIGAVPTGEDSPNSLSFYVAWYAAGSCEHRCGMFLGRWRVADAKKVPLLVEVLRKRARLFLEITPDQLPAGTRPSEQPAA